jgi:hypothetical protein
MSAKPRLFSGPPVASVEALIAVYPGAILTLYHVITGTFPTVVTALSRPVSYAFVVMVTGLCLLARKPTSRAIVGTLGVVSHDALTRLLTHSCWTASLLLGALLNQALLLSTGTLLPSLLILDDVLIPKPFARRIAGAYWDWDHAQRRRTFGHRVVVVIWTNGALVIPVAFALWHKQYSAYFLAPQTCFSETEYQQFLTRFPAMRPLLDGLVLREPGQVVLPLTRLMAWQKTLIPKPAWAVLASHATNGRRYRTKNELARCLIYRVVRKGLRSDYITFDSWYASKENLNMLTRLRLVYVTAVPCSRKLSSAYRLRSAAPVITSACRVDALARMFATRDYVPYPQARLRALRFRVTLTGLTHPAQVVIITRQDWHGFLRRTLPDDHPIQQHTPAAPNVYLLTNAPHASTYQVICRYRSRWTIECLFRNLKQHLGLGACQHCHLEAVTRHIALAMFAAGCLHLIRQSLSGSAVVPSGTMTIGDVKKHLQSQVVIVGTQIENSGIVTGELRPMTRDLFEQLTAPKRAAVIGHSMTMTVESPAIKELYNDA